MRDLFYEIIGYLGISLALNLALLIMRYFTDFGFFAFLSLLVVTFILYTSFKIVMRDKKDKETILIITIAMATIPLIYLKLKFMESLWIPLAIALAASLLMLLLAWNLKTFYK
ncbi:hypothetical protein HYV56_01100 [Candidatus Peregrinibacteria bacterium]|nr:hypothetical protein [Candidatus Peregrinibacteria bacterium]